MNTDDKRPPVWIGHVAMHSPRVNESSKFMQLIGMRLITSGEEFAVLEMREPGGSTIPFNSSHTGICPFNFRVASPTLSR